MNGVIEFRFWLGFLTLNFQVLVFSSSRYLSQVAWLWFSFEFGIGFLMRL